MRRTLSHILTKAPTGSQQKKTDPTLPFTNQTQAESQGEVQRQYRRHWKPTIFYKRFWWLCNYLLTKLKAPIPSLTPPSNSWKNCCSTLFFWSICRIERHSLDWRKKLENKFIMTLKMIVKSNFTLTHHKIIVIGQNSRDYLGGCCCVEFYF